MRLRASRPDEVTSTRLWAVEPVGQIGALVRFGFSATVRTVTWAGRAIRVAEPAYEVGHAMNQVHEYFLGIDVSKHKLDVALLRMGKTRSKVVSNTAEGYAQLEAWLRAQGATAEATHVCLESTGSYGEGISFHLSDAGWYVSVVNPAQVTGFAQGELQRNKTDRNDAALLARFCERMRPGRWVAPSIEWRQLRAKVDRLESLKAMRQQESNRLEAQRAGHDGGLISDIEEHIDWLSEKIAALEDDINNHIDGHPHLKADAELMKSVPGIGNLTTMKLLSYLGDLRRFDSAKALAAYIGVTPRRRESGSSIKGRSSITRAGNAAVRHALYMPGLVALRYNPVMKSFGERLAAGGLAPKAVVGAAMRKLVHILYAVIKSGKPFDPEFRPKGVALQDGI